MGVGEAGLLKSPSMKAEMGLGGLAMTGGSLHTDSGRGRGRRGAWLFLRMRTVHEGGAVWLDREDEDDDDVADEGVAEDGRVDDGHGHD